jgi:hypothetical protein
MSAPDALVLVDLAGTPHLAGRLWIHARGSSQRATFEYDATWITGEHRFALEPALSVGVGPFHTAAGRALFGAIGDSAPDRWGRTLLARRERLAAAAEVRTPQSLREIDYLLGMSDFTRQGALRFKRTLDGPSSRVGENTSRRSSTSDDFSAPPSVQHRRRRTRRTFSCYSHRDRPDSGPDRKRRSEEGAVSF